MNLSRSMKLVLGGGAAVIAVLAAAATAAYLGYDRARTPFKGFSEEELFVTVPSGSSAASIARQLEAAGVIRESRLFLLALRLSDESSRLQAGEYRFALPLSTLEVADRLVDGDVYTVAVTVPEGLTVAETAAHLASQGIGEEAALAQAFSELSLVSGFAGNVSSLEGYLFPTTYHFTRNPEPAVVARAMVGQFEEVFDAGKRAKAEALGLELHEVVTLASIVEKETGAPDERPLIASVFWNRLQRGMALASDPTIIYALKLANEFDGNLRRVDLELESPYNTYRVPGIPPGPIASPGEASINAVLEPAETAYLFFVSKNDGTSYFSTNFREHANAVRKYQVEYFRNRRRRNNGDGSS